METARCTSEVDFAIARVPSLVLQAAILLGSKTLKQKLEFAYFRFHRERVFGLIDDLDGEHPIVTMLF